MNSTHFTAPELGDLAYEYLLVVLDEVIQTRQTNWAIRDVDKWPFPYSIWLKVTLRLESNIFADLAYCIWSYSKSDEYGQQQLYNIIDEYFDGLFSPAIRKALSLVDAENIHGLLSGVRPYMLKALFEKERWLPLLKQDRTLPLFLLVDYSITLSHDISDIIRFEYDNLLLIDYSPGNSGAAGLIHAIVFQPDLMFLDISLVGISGDDMIWYIQKQTRHQKTPYCVVTAVSDYIRENLDQEHVLALQNGAMDIVIKPFTVIDILDAKKFLRSQGYIN